MDLGKHPIVYTGNTRNLRQVKDITETQPGLYIQEHKDTYSIINWGIMPDELKDKGKINAILNAFIFEELGKPETWQNLESDNYWDIIEDEQLRNNLKKSRYFEELKEDGMRTHYKGILIDDGIVVKLEDLKEPINLLLIDGVRIIKPEKYDKIWDYTMFQEGMDNFSIPLEVVFRLGVPGRSCFTERINKNPQYLEIFDLKEEPKEGDWLERPVLEYFTKYEPDNGHLIPEEAKACSGLREQEFAQMNAYTYFISLYLTKLFKKIDANVWDGKLEYIKIWDRIFLSGAIGWDELTVTKNGKEIGTGMLEQYHEKHQPEWYNHAMELQNSGNPNWRQDCIKNGYEPKPIESEFFKELMKYMYCILTNEITERKFFKDIKAILDTLINS